MDEFVRRMCEGDGEAFGEVVDALPHILREAQRRGFRLLTISQLLSETVASTTITRRGRR